MPLQDAEQVTLEAFQGPLDLLLSLIRRAEVDVNEIPIARITDQYLEFLHEIEEIDIDLAGDFLVMASTLIEIKSRTLMPPAPPPPADGPPADGPARLAPALASSEPTLKSSFWMPCSAEMSLRRRITETATPIIEFSSSTAP